MAGNSFLWTLNRRQGKITLASGELGIAFRKGLAQVAEWETWLDARFQSMKETFDKYRQAGTDLPEEFTTIGTSHAYISRLLLAEGADFLRENLSDLEDECTQRSVACCFTL